MDFIHIYFLKCLCVHVCVHEVCVVMKGRGQTIPLELKLQMSLNHSMHESAESQAQILHKSKGDLNHEAISPDPY